MPTVMRRPTPDAQPLQEGIPCPAPPILDIEVAAFRIRKDHRGGRTPLYGCFQVEALYVSLQHGGELLGHIHLPAVIVFRQRFEDAVRIVSTDGEEPRL